MRYIFFIYGEISTWLRIKYYTFSTFLIKVEYKALNNTAKKLLGQIDFLMINFQRNYPRNIPICRQLILYQIDYQY